MTTMKDVLRLHRQMKEMGLQETLENGEEAIQITNAIGDYVNDVSTKAEKLVLEKLPERDFVEAINALSATVIYGMLVQDGSFAPMQFLMSGEMQPFVHTLILATIGMLVDEEVL